MTVRYERSKKMESIGETAQRVVGKVDGERKKRDKESVDYSHGKPHAHCGLCRHFIKPNSCHLVQGKIEPQMWCELFAPKPRNRRSRYVAP